MDSCCGEKYELHHEIRYHCSRPRTGTTFRGSQLEIQGTEANCLEHRLQSPFKVCLSQSSTHVLLFNTIANNLYNYEFPVGNLGSVELWNLNILPSRLYLHENIVHTVLYGSVRSLIAYYRISVFFCAPMHSTRAFSHSLPQMFLCILTAPALLTIKPNATKWPEIVAG